MNKTFGNDIKIGIVGGKGAMGSFFKKFFEDKGFDTLISDIDTKLTNKDIATLCDVVFLSVPIDKTFDVIKEVAPLLSENKLLSDFTSLKEDVVATMLTYSKSDVIGMHPMFGPFTENLKGQNIVFCEGRDKNGWEEKFTTIFEAGGLHINKMTPQEHDKHMAFVQGLTHLISITMGRVVQKKNCHPNITSSFSTPIYRLNNDLVGRLFAQDLSLYYSIITENKYIKENSEIFLESFMEVQNVLLNQDKKKSSIFLDSIKKFLNFDFCTKAFKRSSKVLDTFFK